MEMIFCVTFFANKCERSAEISFYAKKVGGGSALRPPDFDAPSFWAVSKGNSSCVNVALS